jgi:hypothetical protein
MSGLRSWWRKLPPDGKVGVANGSFALAMGHFVFIGGAFGAGGVGENSTLLLRLALCFLATAAMLDIPRERIVSRLRADYLNLARCVFAGVLAALFAIWAAAAPASARTLFLPVYWIVAL